jgi:pilus assembly protein CpaF
LPRDAAHAQLAAALEVVIHLQQDVSGLRLLREVAVLTRTVRGVVEAVNAVKYGPDGTSTEGAGAARLQGLLADGGRG